MNNTRTARRICPVLVTAAALVLTVPAPDQAAAAHHHAVPTYQVPRGSGKSAVTLNVDNAPIKAVLRLLFRRANQSYVFGPRVSGNVTASLHSVPFDTALNQLLSANSVRLTKTLVNGVYVIKGQPQPARRSAPKATPRQPVTPQYRRRPQYRRPQYVPQTYTVPGTGGGVRIAP